MSSLKTQPHEGDVRAYLASIEPEKKRDDASKILALMEDVTGEPATMWGDSMIGFGKYHYKYKSGREGEWFLTGFAPRKQNLTLYIMAGFDEYGALLGKLGKYKTGKSCLYIKKIEDVDESVLRELVVKSVDHMKATNETS